jgi:transcriptional regulator with XRE-family HTH domain
MAKLGTAAPAKLALPRLRALRVARGLTQRMLAARAGMSISTVSRFELGLWLAEPKHVMKLAAALGVDPVELVEGTNGQIMLNDGHGRRVWASLPAERAP